MVSMELCKASSRFCAGTAPERWKSSEQIQVKDHRVPSSTFRPVSASSGRKITLVHFGCQRTLAVSPNEPLRRDKIRASSNSFGSALCIRSGHQLVCGLKGTMSMAKQASLELQSACPHLEETYLLLEDHDKRNPKTLTKLRRITLQLIRAADVSLHSMTCQKECQTTRHPGLQFPSSSLYSISHIINPRRSSYSLMPPTCPTSGPYRVKKWELGTGLGEDLPADYQDDDPLKRLPQRRCGILLHPSSLPGPHGIGDLGKDAFGFLDWLKETGCTVWQVLPLVPPGRKGGEDGSPYAGADANCGNTLLISLDELVKDGLLEETDLPKPVPVTRMNSSIVAAVKEPLITKAASTLVSSSGKLKEEFGKFRTDPRNSSWLEEAALFAAIDQSIAATTWWNWPPLLRDRDLNAMKEAHIRHKDFIDNFIAAQFLFQRQWQAIHKYANDAGIKILGDMPIYVGGHSADVWSHRSLFSLDPKTGIPATVSGVPPDAFSTTGQLWGSPLYDWKEMAKDKYSWWAARLRRACELYDEFRVDHFRGFAGYWAIPASAQNAMTGKWKAGPGKEFFRAMKEAVGNIKIIAEDLGIITGDVVTLRKESNAPGMAVLQFAFGNNPRNPHLPHNHELDQVVYPGTHDNDTCMGWWKKASEKEKEMAKSYLRFKKENEVHWDFIRGAVASVAQTAMIPMQDVMGLDNNARMNIPATQAGNWGWRIGESDIFEKLEKEKNRLRDLLATYNRLTRRFQDTVMDKRTHKSAAKSVGEKIHESLDKLKDKSIEKLLNKVVGKTEEKSPHQLNEKPHDKPKDKPTDKPKVKPVEKPKRKPNDDRKKR